MEIRRVSNGDATYCSSRCQIFASSNDSANCDELLVSYGRALRFKWQRGQTQSCLILLEFVAVDVPIVSIT